MVPSFYIGHNVGCPMWGVCTPNTGVGHKCKICGRLVTVLEGESGEWAFPLASKALPDTEVSEHCVPDSRVACGYTHPALLRVRGVPVQESTFWMMHLPYHSPKRAMPAAFQIELSTI